LAFAAEGGGSSFDKVTLPFINGLGSRLAAWVDHHDHERHVDYAGDPRFVLSTKAEHGACPEMVTPEVVAHAGPVDTVAVHMDLDGLYAGAKWALGGVEPYEGADAPSIAADFESGRDFVKLFELGGGMPTRVSVPEARLDEVLLKLGAATAHLPKA